MLIHFTREEWAKLKEISKGQERTPTSQVRAWVRAHLGGVR